MDGHRTKCGVACEGHHKCKEMHVCVQESTPRGKKLKKGKICKPPSMVSGLGLGISGSGSESGSGSHSNGGQVADIGAAEKYHCSAFLQTLQASHNNHSECISQINVIASFLKLKKKDSDECVSACDALHNISEGVPESDSAPPLSSIDPESSPPHTPSKSSHRFNCSEWLQQDPAVVLSGTKPCRDAVADLHLKKKEKAECKRACNELN